MEVAYLVQLGSEVLQRRYLLRVRDTSRDLSRMNRADQGCRPFGGKWKGLLQRLDGVVRAV